MPNYNKELLDLIKQLFEERLNSKGSYHKWSTSEIICEYNAALAEACLKFIK